MIILLFSLLAPDCVGWGLFALVLIPVFMYYFWYGIEFLVKLCIILLSRKIKFNNAWYEAYSRVSFEQEAVQWLMKYISLVRKDWSTLQWDF